MIWHNPANKASRRSKNASYLSYSYRNELKMADPIHTGFLDAMRDLDCEFPVTQALLDYLKSHPLTSADLENPEWITAPVTVTSNAERWSMMSVMAVEFATLMGVPIITWEYETTPNKTDEKDKINHAALFKDITSKPELRSQLFSMAAGTLGIFIKGAPAFIDQNCNNSKNVSNGTKVEMHSLLFDDHDGDPEAIEAIRQVQLLIDKALPGVELRIDLNPNSSTCYSNLNRYRNLCGQSMNR